MTIGDYARDKISGFTGIVVGQARYMHMPPKVEIQPEGLDQNGRPIASVWFSESGVERIDKPQMGLKGKATP